MSVRTQDRVEGIVGDKPTTGGCVEDAAMDDAAKNGSSKRAREQSPQQKNALQRGEDLKDDAAFVEEVDASIRECEADEPVVGLADVVGPAPSRAGGL
jgi:hypothetical protein